MSRKSWSWKQERIACELGSALYAAGRHNKLPCIICPLIAVLAATLATNQTFAVHSHSAHNDHILRSSDAATTYDAIGQIKSPSMSTLVRFCFFRSDSQQIPYSVLQHFLVRLSLANCRQIHCLAPLASPVLSYRNQTRKSLCISPICSATSYLRCW